ncbi:type II toxin-antitoxin system VapC family toxin [Hyphomonas sp.]|uniref:type II toxin-antitoxin system VapC family toxin n=1 Tax=Hyphomonas sp. TaxID=87 RepID=UPI0025B83407|nr:type II toxin-antitoxin system VapC family toxin [Hyphomonas sp.]
MRITADTNVLVRAIVADEPKQARLAQSALARADLIAIGPTTLCEFVWVLSRGYGIATADIAAAIRGLIGSANVEVNRPAVEAGLALLDQGGDFADGIIAFEGASLGGAMFATFDKDAAKRLKKLGRDTLLLA